MPPFFSIVIPVIKTRYFRQALDSVLSQSGVDAEVLVVDNHADADLDWVKDYAGVNLIRREVRLPLAENWNDALRHAMGEYVLFLSDDDYLEFGSLEGLASHLKAYPVPVVTTLGMRKVEESGAFVSDSHPGRTMESLEYALFQYFGNGRDIGMNLVFARQRFLDLGGFIPVRGSGNWIDVMTYFKCASVAPAGSYNHLVLNYRMNPAGVSRVVDVNQLSWLTLDYEIFVRRLLSDSISQSAMSDVIRREMDAYFLRTYTGFLIQALTKPQLRLAKRLFCMVAPSPRDKFCLMADLAFYAISRLLRKAIKGQRVTRFKL